MMERLEERAEAVARRRVAAALDAIAADLPPDVDAAPDGDSVVLRGRGLVRRMAFDPRFAAIGWTR